MRKTRRYQIDIPEKEDFADVEKISEAFDRFDQQLYELIYPVGSVYISAIDTDPAMLFGGTWEKIHDSFLLASGSRQIGATGGEETHMLTLEELPAHSHKSNTKNEYFVTSEESGAGSWKVSVGSGSRYVDGQPTDSLSNKAGFINRGVKAMPYLYVLNHTNAPAMLIEICFCDSKEDYDLYKKFGGSKAIAKCIADAIEGA